MRRRVPRQKYKDLEARYQRAVQARHELADQLTAAQDALRTAARQYCDADTTATRLKHLEEHCRVLEEECLAAQQARELYMTQHQEETARLQRELDLVRRHRNTAARLLTDVPAIAGTAVVLRRRLHRMVRACARYRIQLAARDRMILAQQRQLDSALGLDSHDIEAGANWQARRVDKTPWGVTL